MPPLSRHGKNLVSYPPFRVRTFRQLYEVAYHHKPGMGIKFINADAVIFQSAEKPFRSYVN